MIIWQELCEVIIKRRDGKEEQHPVRKGGVVMKRILKFCIIAAVVILLAGAGTGAVISYVKGPEYLNNLLQETTGGRMEVWFAKVEEIGDIGKDILEKLGEGTDKLIEGVKDGYDSFEGYDINDATLFDQKEPIESGDIDKVLEGMSATLLDIKLGGSELEILMSEDGTARVVSENVGKLQAYQQDNSLMIRAARNAIETAEKSKISLYLPAGYTWQGAAIDVGAGYVHTKALDAEQVKLKVGAGKIEIGSLASGNLELSVGAGSIVIADAQISGLALEVGMGSVELKGSVDGSVKAECSMGNVRLQLAGEQTEYDYEIDCVAGNVTVGTEKYGGASVQEQHINNNAGRKIDLECSMGNIQVSFLQ